MPHPVVHFEIGFPTHQSLLAVRVLDAPSAPEWISRHTPVQPVGCRGL
jgi:hypothetical protein